jgi:SET domain-containing protein
MFVVRTRLGPSTIHGMGAFAIEPIRKGQVVWQFDPRVDIRMTASELSKFPPAVQEHIISHCYVEMQRGEKVIVLCADNAQYINHSLDPNMIDIEDGLVDVAARDIAVGEELTSNYYDSDLAVDEKLGKFTVEA